MSPPFRAVRQAVSSSTPPPRPRICGSRPSEVERERNAASRREALSLANFGRYHEKSWRRAFPTIRQNAATSQKGAKLQAAALPTACSVAWVGGPVRKIDPNQSTPHE